MIMPTEPPRPPTPSIALPQMPDGPAREHNPLDLIRGMLDEQQDLTAVERFSRAHPTNRAPAQERYYRDLMPATPPGLGQQYAFEVDLDACTGCKACVVGCHTRNGLDDTETWRDVSSIHGGTHELPVLQTVTQACNHCLEPGCLQGCPVDAYEKDPDTGIVKHLDDQCIGCQYCTFMCPYDAPKYNNRLGIVRKCDMCSQRIEKGEAPACVQACPHEAIKITLVDVADVKQDASVYAALPGMPDPSYTKPTTRYITRKHLPANMVDVVQGRAVPEHAHPPLVLMLVLTQMSVGAFIIEALLDGFFGTAQLDLIRPIHTASALVLGLVALGASTLHLGRPMYAFRAVIGLRHSWLSREIVTFGAFAKLAMAYAAVVWLFPEQRGWHLMLGGAVAATGLAGVFCSVMIYHVTRRALWHFTSTATRFLLTGAVLGVPTVLATSLVTAAAHDDLAVDEVMAGWGYWLCGALMFAAGLKLAYEGGIFLHLRDHRHAPLRRTAELMLHRLTGSTLRRFLFGILGGVVAPGVLLLASLGQAADAAGPSPVFMAIVSVLTLGLCLTAELHERFLFFSAVVSARQPGGIL